MNDDPVRPRNDLCVEESNSTFRAGQRTGRVAFIFKKNQPVSDYLFSDMNRAYARMVLKELPSCEQVTFVGSR